MLKMFRIQFEIANLSNFLIFLCSIYHQIW